MLTRAMSLRILMLAMLSLVPALAQQPAQASPPQDPPYSHPFGDNPYLPSNAKIEGDGFTKPTDFATASWCGKCHTEIYKQWRESVHANSFREPFYTKNVNLLITTKGVQYTRHCEGCHNPIALFSGARSEERRVGKECRCRWAPDH